MKLLSFVLTCCTIFNAVYCQYDVETLTTCNEVESKSTLLRLKRHLFCDYDYFVRPVTQHTNAITVKFVYLPKLTEFMSSSDSINIHAWLMLVWTDSYITWTPAAFDDIKEIHVTTSEIWTPDITALNGDADMISLPETHCRVSSKGDVRCTLAIMHSTHCNVDHTWWPYEVRNCTLSFGSWAHTAEEITIKSMHDGVSTSLYEQNSEWFLERAHVTEYVEPFKLDSNLSSQTISIYFTFKRHTGIIHTTYIIPAIALMIMSLMTLWLEPKSTERMIVVNLNFVCHLLCMRDLHWEMPHNSGDAPKLLLYYEASLVLVLFTLILTSLLRQLEESKTDAPKWISTIASQILLSKVGRILLVSILYTKASAELEIEADDSMNLVQSNQKRSTWKYVVILIGWVAFFSVCIAYIIILSMFLPTENCIKF